MVVIFGLVSRSYIRYFLFDFLGLIIQPIIGAWSDKVDWKYGRRKPFIVIGTLLIILNLIIIAYSYKILSLFIIPTKIMVLSLVVFCFYVLDFSINTVQCSLRSLIIDVAPIHQQETANAYAGRMISLGSITGFLTGGINLKYWTGLDPMEALSIVASFMMLFALCTCVFVKELKNDNIKDMSVLRIVKDIYRSFRNLPDPIQKICNVQFFSWFGWFPFLFYSTLWISEVLKNSVDYSKPDFLDYASRVGSLALFIHSVTTLVFSIILPMITKNNFTSDENGIGLKKINLYFIANIWFAILMIASIFVRNINYGILLISLLGISWSIMMWVPFSLIGEWVQILKDGTVDSGIVLGIHNCYVVIPQFLSNFLCSLIFVLYQQNTLINGPVALIFFLTTVSSLYASYLSYKLPSPSV